MDSELESYTQKGRENDSGEMGGQRERERDDPPTVVSLHPFGNTELRMIAHVCGQSLYTNKAFRNDIHVIT